MQRWTSVVFALLFAGAIALVILRVGGEQGAADGAAAFDGGTDGGPTDAGALPDLSDPIFDDTLGLGLDEPIEEVARVDAGGTLLPSGEPAPALPAEAPKSVIFGVILVTYQGAQGAPKSARPRDEAARIAGELAAEAKADFVAAVAKGDPGSLENAGAIPKGVLEPAPEYVLFSLEKGGVSEPVDTPRGFWIVKRIE